MQLVLAATLVGCGNKKEEEFGSTTTTKISVDLGKSLFEGKGTCIACHKENTKIIGPSIKEIATIYNEKNGDLVSFLKGNEEPIVDPSQFEIMKANFSITKTMTDDELESIKLYMYSIN